MRGNAWSRGAEDFDALVSGRAGDSEAHADLLELVAALRAVPPVTARPEFVSSLRTQLIAAAEREPARTEEDLALRLTPRQRRGSRERRLAAVIGGFAVVSATGSMAMASQDALPGDVLYPVKRAIEDAQTNLQPDGAAKADALISHAEARLDELQSLLAHDAEADEVNATLQDFTDQARQASGFALEDYAATGKSGRIVDLRAFAGDSMDVLAGLGPLVPSESRSALITATQTIRQIDVSAWEACPTCAGGAVTEVPDFATLPLSAVLSGDLTASVTDAAPLPTKKDKAPQAPATPAPTTVAPPLLPPVELPTVPNPTKSPTNPLGETVEGVTKGLTDTLGINGGSQTTDGTATDPGLVPGLVDGLTGIVGGLLGGK
ncbi:DUF5667 domain-containing protein [Nocardioides daeguensis]|uniref:DUF5667 domain-containing protein n=1 Tax=Nocardioides daeguensis TaxID=908359 RepID=A0ABP6V1X6_9ACTN|nr:DUF5667 domain-containing protein [Nocardioides daeguensis]MBV6726965.1 hypothetical protein [Nocardioides daeguensis]MCR1771631.1 hypothetical protein [Nocardioides daeguensis]